MGRIRQCYRRIEWVSCLSASHAYTLLEKSSIWNLKGFFGCQVPGIALLDSISLSTEGSQWVIPGTKRGYFMDTAKEPFCSLFFLGV